MFFYKIIFAPALIMGVVIACSNPPASPPVNHKEMHVPAQIVKDSAPPSFPETTLKPSETSKETPPAPTNTIASNENQPTSPRRTEPAPYDKPTPIPTVSKDVPVILLSHERWDALLQRFVSDAGKVNYKGFQANKQALDDYLQSLSTNPPKATWAKAEQMAFWINAYNAFTIKLISDHYPLKSILDLDGGKTWDVKRIKIGDKMYSLNNIENDILRPQFKDARIHFAINCAAQSCPPLANHAFTSTNLEKMLEEHAKKFINNSQFNQLTGSPIKVSKIFDWYAADFGDLVGFLNRYAVNKAAAGTKVEYLEYNWELND